MKKENEILLASVATLIGTVVGAGFLGIPKALTLSGIVPGLILMILVAVAMLFMCLFATELALNTKEVYQMPGLIRKYAGNKAGIVASFIFALISIGAIVAYLIACSDIISKYTGLPHTVSMTLYFGAIFYLVYRGLKFVEKAEIYLGIAMFLFIFIFAFFMYPNFKIERLMEFKTTNLLTPFGIILFAFGGYNVMIQIEEITNGNKKLMIETSILGVVIPFVFFLTFAVIVLGVYGSNVADIATESFEGILGVIGNLIAFSAMTSSYIISGLLLRDMLVNDYNMSKRTSSIIAMFLPYLFTLIASPSFIGTLSFTGAVLAGLFAIMVAITVIIQRKKVKKPAYTAPGGIVAPILIAIFFAIGMLVIFE